MTSFKHRQVQANGICLHVASAGDPKKPAVMFLHGFPEGWFSWRSIMQALADDYFVLAPDLRGYGQSDKPAAGYGLMTLTDDIHDIVTQLTDKPITLVGHDWGGALAWMYGHRFGETLRQLVVVNCPHPHTFVKAIMRGQDWQRIRSSYMVFLLLPWLPETLITSAGGWFLRRGLKLAEGSKGAMNADLVDELARSFRTNRDVTGPVNFYREFLQNQLSKSERTRLLTEFTRPIPVPCTLIWGDKDHFLSQTVAKNSHEEAHCDVEWRPLPGVGHFVSLEAPDRLVAEVRTVLARSVALAGYCSVRPTWDAASGLTIRERRLTAMGSSTSRDQILEALQDLPSDATFDDAIERLIFLAKIDAGLSEIDAGKGIPHDEVKRRLSQ